MCEMYNGRWFISLACYNSFLFWLGSVSVLKIIFQFLVCYPLPASLRAPQLCLGHKRRWHFQPSQCHLCPAHDPHASSNDAPYLMACSGQPIPILFVPSKFVISMVFWFVVQCRPHLWTALELMSQIIETILTTTRVLTLKKKATP